ncbi:MAG: ADP-ribosylglycohydrolase family protein [Deltaproteobacteria bacterium]|nr:ADP-ribosylglycohydrolase family protein [Deltaproteobacteria bacterium]
MERQRSRGIDRYRGCLIGGAVGDALGWPVEFLSLDAIRIRHGTGGIRDLVPAAGGLAEVSDDTQMTLFTAEGLLDAGDVRGGGGSVGDRGDRGAVASVHRAYLRWLRTQGGRSEHPAFSEPHTGGLFAVSRVHAVRAPGNTCLSALRGPHAGTVEAPVNDSKGCGGVMRAAPAGLFARDVASAFGLGCDVAALTHGHPSGYLSAGVLAAAVRAIVEGASLPAALDAATAELRRRPRHEECLAALERGRALAASCGLAPPAPEALHRLGGGWVGEEALAIAACCALAAPDFESALIAAVNHSGDSDSTGSIAGNLLGAALGVEAIPRRWLDRVELRAETEGLADRLRAA